MIIWECHMTNRKAWIFTDLKNIYFTKISAAIVLSNTSIALKTFEQFWQKKVSMSAWHLIWRFTLQ